MTKTSVFATGLGVLLLAVLPPAASAYSVLTHEAIVDTIWTGGMRPALKRRYPAATEAELREAHAYAYGGCIIQDLGYYPFGDHFFSDLAHYVRSADFVQALVDESRNLNEYAFALGAAAHYGADIYGHSIAVNHAVPVLYPKLRRLFGDDITYADNPEAHLKTEFGFDVLQVARGHYAPTEYHDFIGFAVSKEQLDRAVQDTYGLTLKDMFGTLDLALGTYRFSVSKMIPAMTRAAWDLKKDQIAQEQPTITRKQFQYNLKRASYRKEWGTAYQKPGVFDEILAFFARLLPKVGPFSGFGYKLPTAQTEKMFEDSFNAAVVEDLHLFGTLEAGNFDARNRDLDTGNRVSPGEYKLTDRTYDRLLLQLDAKNFEGVTPDLRENILNFYARMKRPDPHGTGPALAALKALRLDKK
jgi:hypothetical protein